MPVVRRFDVVMVLSNKLVPIEFYSIDLPVNGHMGKTGMYSVGYISIQGKGLR